MSAVALVALLVTGTTLGAVIKYRELWLLMPLGASAVILIAILSGAVQ